ncbi:NADH:flavin oxidoreductase/NADH oxidase family protein [Acinetobacter ursingii]|uniref:NADH:flavin oxidoreductase/NADH oxidase family protein n=1 Tax=Acinetobacter ursingii TaxID=108980 RepID=UPI0021CD4FB6|nr:NADH:flavin oxidoreductase/NADH oxidase family protein [Acinetobacter ursingii]MCU4482968.1 NADH:flavin oxidoreductase/NADH oxidase family protein [Acinetobacter ursingii]MCU4507290.1 NADH:flavin oxidoreductase/NADH oxidase family protein [Acinetobacter ursingii]MCU4570410.1 NADH:flavin oxidoreductase/NADH oxidase family protein [Acinetobacter ursingii]
MKVFEKLVLPNGSQIQNRIAKAAMEENMADLNHAPSEELMHLYQAWANGGVGLIITGNVMVDRRAMTGPGGVVLEDDKFIDTFKRWAQVGRSQGAQFWLQINHPGRQMQSNLGQETWAPSAVGLDLGKMSDRFSVPIEMTQDMIHEVIQRFANTARLGEQAGFTGVEIHAAHGYLLSQFLSPLSNKRQDQWGGSLENRARILIEIVKAVRAVVSPTFTVAVKLNSADFQRGGFSAEDAQQVVLMLNELAVDLVELSGGSYEAPAMQGQSRDGRTLAREAYFLEFAQEIRKVANMPVMVTGGIRRKQVAEKVIESGVDMVGIATALAIDPNLPNEWKQRQNTAPELKPITWDNKTLASLANMATVKFQLRKLSLGKKPNPKVSPLWALILQQAAMARRTRQYKKRMRDYAFSS